MKRDEEDNGGEEESNLPDMTKIYEAISQLLELTIFVAKMNDESEEISSCKDGDLRDWPEMNDDYTDEFKGEFE